MNIFVFSLKTIPDLDAGRRLYALQDVSGKEVGSIMFHKRRQQTGSSEILPLHLQRVVSLSVLLRTQDELLLRTFSGDEQEILQAFVGLHEDFQPLLVGWNCQRNDLPLLNYRLLAKQVTSPSYWHGAECEDDHCDQEHDHDHDHQHDLRSLDLSDELNGDALELQIPLIQMAAVCGMPLPVCLDNAQTWKHYLADELSPIAACSDLEAITTYRLFLRYQLINGGLAKDDYHHEAELLRSALQQQSEQHFQTYLNAWSQAD